MTTFDRFAEGYEPRFDIDSEVGRQGELFIGSVVDALRNGSVEVKSDEVAARTGNFYVEFQCLIRGVWRPSGIATTEADMWAFALGSARFAVIVPTSLLKTVARDRYHAGHVRECMRGSHPTKGVTVPFRFLFQWVNEHKGAA